MRINQCCEDGRDGLFRLVYCGFHFRSWHRHLLSEVTEIILYRENCGCGDSSSDDGELCVPLFFTVEPCVVIDKVSWRCIQTVEYFTASIRKIYEIFDSITTPLLPITFILFFNALTVRRIIVANRVRRVLRNSSANQRDPEVQNNRKSMMFLFALSGNFILL